VVSKSSLLEERILRFLREIDEPIIQPEIARRLNVSSRDVSRILAKLEKKGVIKREKVIMKGRRTFKVFPLREAEPLDALLECPCFSCPYLEMCGEKQEHDPSTCRKLTEWLLSLTTKTAT